MTTNCQSKHSNCFPVLYEYFLFFLIFFLSICFCLVSFLFYFLKFKRGDCNPPIPVTTPSENPPMCSILQFYELRGKFRQLISPSFYFGPVYCGPLPNIMKLWKHQFLLCKKEVYIRFSIQLYTKEGVSQLYHLTPIPWSANRSIYTVKVNMHNIVRVYRPVSSI